MGIEEARHILFEIYHSAAIGEMAPFNIGRIMLRKSLINGFSYKFNYVRYYGRTGALWTNSSGSSKGSEIEEDEVLTEEDKRRFDGLLPEISSCLTSYNDHRLRPAMERIKPVLEYASPHAYKVNLLMTLAAYKILSVEHSEEQLKKASILDWCTQMLMTSFGIADDICDNSVTRRGKPCWYRLENVGLPFALNDVLLLDHGVYWLLKTYFQHEPYYVNLVDLFHEVQLQCTSSQILDIWLSSQHLNFDQFNDDNFNALSSNNGIMLAVYLPLVSAMYMVGNPDKEVLQMIQSLCINFCRLANAKDDYADCFDLPHGSDVIGNDIEEGKCTWLIVNALKLVDEEGRNQLRKWYGKKDPELAKLVYNKYVELQLDQLFIEHEKEIYDSIATAVGKLPSTFPTGPFYYYLQRYLTFNFQT